MGKIYLLGILGCIYVSFFLGCKGSDSVVPVQVIPDAPINLSATGNSATSIKLCWGSKSTNVDYFIVFKPNAVSYVHDSIGIAFTTEYIDTNCLQSKVYKYRFVQSMG